VTAVTDPLNYVTRYTYDNLNQLTKITDATGKDLAFVYDADGNLRLVRDQRGASESTTQFTLKGTESLDPLVKQTVRTHG
jgi:YD repeat-containing protein